MGAHRSLDDRTIDVARVVGRGALATSVAVALAGTGAGFATAMPDDDGDGHGEWHGHDGGHDEYGADGWSSDCTALEDDGVDGLLDGLGLSRSQDECATGPDAATSDAPGPEGESADAGSAPSASTDGSDPGTRRAAAPVDPEDVPPAPGETRIVDLPDRPST